MASDMQTKNKPSGWLKLFLVLSISGGILITLYSLLLLANILILGIELLCCGAIMAIFGFCAWSAYKKGLPAALSFSKGCIAAFSLFILNILCYLFLDGIIYDKVGYTSGFIFIVLLLTVIWCGAWLLFLSKSKQVRRLVAGNSPRGSKTVISSIAILAFGLIVSSANFYITESNVHHTREMRYLADQLKASQEELIEVEGDEDESTGDYSGNGYRTAKTTNRASTPKRAGGSIKAVVSNTGNVSSNASTNNKSSEESHTKACEYCNSTGRVHCKYCDGKGNVMAPIYQFTPPFFIHYEEITCPTCKGEGSHKCGLCGGTGRRKVSNSSSSGSSTYQHLPNVSTYPTRSSTDNTSQPTYTKCPICGGSGVCSSCGGTGGKWEDVGYYVGSDTKSWIKCPSCNGNKRCYNCHGSGRQ